MDSAVVEYRKRRQKRLDSRFHKDEPEEETNNRQNNRNHGGHGNTKLPYGLCHRYGISIEKGWTPRDAWDALAEKGVTPTGEFEKRKGNSTFKSRFGTVYSNISAEKTSGGKYALFGDFEMGKTSGKHSKYHDFICKDEMYAFLKENGVSRFKDPDSGDIVNPKKMDLPRTVAKIGETRYKDLTLGYRTDRTGHPYTGRGFAIAGQDFTGKRTVLKVFSKITDAKAYAKKIGCSEDDLRLTADLKKYAKPTVG